MPRAPRRVEIIGQRGREASAESAYFDAIPRARTFEMLDITLRIHEPWTITTS